MRFAFRFEKGRGHIILYTTPTDTDYIIFLTRIYGISNFLIIKFLNRGGVFIYEVPVSAEEMHQ